MRDRTFRTVYPLWIVLNVAVVALIGVLVGVAWLFGGSETRGAVDDVPLLGLFVLFTGYFVARGILLAHTVTIHEDGRLTFRRLLSAVDLHPNEIRAVKRSWFRNYLAVDSARGFILLPEWEWNGLHSLLGHLHRTNPAVDLSGIPRELL